MTGLEAGAVTKLVLQERGFQLPRGKAKANEPEVTVAGGDTLVSSPRPPTFRPTDRWNNFRALTNDEYVRTRRLAQDLGFESNWGQSVIGYGRPEGSAARVVRNNPPGDRQLMELAEYFGVEVSQTTLESPNGSRRCVIRLGTRSTVSVELPNQRLGEQIVDVVHTHPGHSMLETYPSSGLTTGNPLSRESPRLSSIEDTNVASSLGVPMRVLSRHFEIRNVACTTTLPLIHKLPE